MSQGPSLFTICFSLFFLWLLSDFSSLALRINNAYDIHMAGSDVSTLITMMWLAVHWRPKEERV